MADEQENVKINFDTNAKTASSDVNKLAGSLDNVEESAKGADKSVNDLDKTFDEVYDGLKPLTARMGEAEDRLYELGLAGKQTSEEYQGLLKKVAEYRKTQIETDKVVDAAATTLGQKLAGGAQLATSAISAVTSGMALFGPVSEDTEKALLKVQAAMAFADSISSLSDMSAQFNVFKNLVVDGYRKIFVAKQAELAVTAEQTIAQRLLNATMLLNPYVAAGAAIAAITIATYAWIKATNEEAKALKIASDFISLNAVETDKLAESIEEAGKQTEGYNTLEVARANALGKSDEQIQKIIQSQKELAVSTAFAFNKEAWNNLLKATEGVRIALQSGDEDLIKKSQENQKAARDIYEKSNDDFNKSIISEAEFRLNAQGEAIDKAREAAEKAAEERRKRLEEEHKTEQELIRMRGEQARAAYEKEVEDYKQFRLNLTDAKTQAEFDEAERVAEVLAEITEEQDKVLLENAERQKKIDEYVIEQKKIVEEKKFGILESGVSFLKTIFGKSKDVQKSALIAESAIGIGKTVQNTLTGNAAALAQGIVQAGPILGPGLAAPAITLNTIQGGLSIAGNVAATAKALSAIGGGSAPSGNLGSTRAGGSAGGAPSVAFNNTAENQIGQSVAKSQAQQSPITVNVLESDITKAQDNVKVLVKTNSF